MGTDILFFEGFELIFTFAVLFAEAVYAVLAFIMVRQVRLMNVSFNTIIGKTFLLLARLHFLLSIGLLFLSLLILL